MWGCWGTRRGVAPTLPALGALWPGSATASWPLRPQTIRTEPKTSDNKDRIPACAAAAAAATQHYHILASYNNHHKPVWGLFMSLHVTRQRGWKKNPMLTFERELRVHYRVMTMWVPAASDVTFSTLRLTKVLAKTNTSEVAEPTAAPRYN